MSNNVVRLSHSARATVAQASLEPELIALRSVEQATRLMVSRIGVSIASLEAQLADIRQRISSIPDGEISDRLANDHALLTAALEQAKTIAASIIVGDEGGSPLQPTGDEQSSVPEPAVRSPLDRD